jgi:hypothetical protein
LALEVEYITAHTDQPYPNTSRHTLTSLTFPPTTHPPIHPRHLPTVSISPRTS